MIKRASLLVLVFSLSACGGRPSGVLDPVSAPVAGTSVVDMLVTTTRSDQEATRAQMFSGERAIGLNFADVSVSIPPDSIRKTGEIQWPSKLPADPAKEFAVLRAERLDQPELLRRFNTRVRSTRHRSVTVFTHGYNTKFDDAVLRFAQIIHDSKAPTVPVLFTWPSRGNVLGYAHDRESANYSRDALESVLAHLARDPEVREINILAHSMGNWVTLEALRQMAIRDKRIAPKIKHVMLAAPDVDIDVFRRQITMIGSNRPPFTIMVSQDDKALSISRRFWGSTARLGEINPEEEPYKSQLAREKLTVIDLTNEKTSDRLNHGKFAASPMIVQLIGKQIADQSLHDGKAGIGDTIGHAATRTAGAFGRAASIAVSAPLAIVDHETREGLSDQFEDLGHKLSGKSQ